MCLEKSYEFIAWQPKGNSDARIVNYIILRKKTPRNQDLYYFWHRSMEIYFINFLVPCYTSSAFLATFLSIICLDSKLMTYFSFKIRRIYNNFKYNSKFNCFYREYSNFFNAN